MNTLAAAVCELMGWADGESLRSRLVRVAPLVASSLGFPQDHLGVEPRFVREVAERCAVNETYFFRHAEQLAATCTEAQRAFPRQRLIIWSAACSTGEEPYSFSMQLCDAGLDSFEVLATDVSESALTVARAARYPEWSFRGVPRAVRERCFLPVARAAGVDVFELQQRYRTPVRFLSHNLLAAPPLREAHVISCRNALIYLHPAAVQAALRHFDSVLAPGGFLMLGTAEQHFAGPLGFEPVERDGLTLLRKPLPQRSSRAEPIERVREPAVAEPAAPAPTPAPPATSSLEAAWCALRAGVEPEARALAEGAAAAQDAEAHLLLATLDEAAGQSLRALEHLRRALYLDPRLIIAHVAQAALYQRLGRDKDATRARSNALRQLRALAPETILRGVTPVTARELRNALEAS